MPNYAFKGRSGSGQMIDGEIEGYRRELDLDTAIARTRFTAGGVAFERQVFSSAPDQVLVVHLSSDTPGQLSFDLDLDRANTRAAEQKLKTALGSAVEIARRGAGGTIRIAFADEKELNRLFEQLTRRGRR